MLKTPNLKTATTMKFNIKNYATLMACACGLTLTSCVGDLDVTPINPQQTQVANDDALFNKLYATFSQSLLVLTNIVDVRVAQRDVEVETVVKAQGKGIVGRVLIIHQLLYTTIVA